MATASDALTEVRREAVFAGLAPKLTPLREAMNALYLADETACVEALIPLAKMDASAQARIQSNAEKLVETVRRNQAKQGGIDAFMQKYDLSSQEGIVLMCLAEALLRIPDANTADKLIEDKLADGNWAEHLWTSQSAFVNFSTFGLMLTGKVMQPDSKLRENIGGIARRLVKRLSEPVARIAMRQAMRIMGHQFVMGRNIGEALKRAGTKEHRNYRHSYDMLGEAALTMVDADQYFKAYLDAIDAIGRAAEKAGGDIFSKPNISVKLSALHPRYEFAKRERVLNELSPRLLELAQRAKHWNIGLTVDAEESERLDISLDVFESVYRDASLDGYEGYGLAVQTYLKRAIALIDWMAALAGEVGRKIPARLVKGAYWDTEIKHCQEWGVSGYPVFTRKASTDISFLACARKVFSLRENIYPMFATHNAHTLASVLEMAGDSREFEFQRLHGMGEELYEEVIGPKKLGVNCRAYAPVGSHEDLLPYLVRRLLENGANTSFVNRIIDEKVPVAEIVSDPIAEIENLESKPHPKILLPRNIYGADRINSRGINLYDLSELASLKQALELALQESRDAAPLIGGKRHEGDQIVSLNPADNRDTAGLIYQANEETIRAALDIAVKAQPSWDRTPAYERGRLLRRAAELFEEHAAELMALCIREAGKSIPDCVSEVREAVDFLRYYAQRCEADFGEPIKLPGPTGESNQLSLHGRGVFVCISPWNFPLAIFTGQVSAALAAGNSVLTKPAEQTSLIGYRAVQLMHEAGIPVDALHFIPGPGRVVGQAAVADPRTAGLAFTGSTETAKLINRVMAERDGIIPVLIAETGGQNAMLVDSSALPEQVVVDVVQSSFNSAGQRCSALRVLFLQDDIAPRVIEMLHGYMGELKIGNPALLDTDVGPVIDQAAKDILDKHAEWISSKGKLIRKLEIPESCRHGTYVAPLAVEIDSLDILEREVFGPILHVVRYRSKDLEKIIESINNTGYGLTLGVHSRIDSEARHIQSRVAVGNAYINRNMIGAVVGVQPFGGQGLSGTGPKAGGPHYLHRFATERTLSINTAAVGGNTSLLSMGSD